MKVKALCKASFSLISKNWLWDIECSAVKPIHFELFLREYRGKSKYIFAYIQAQKVLKELNLHGYLKDYNLPPFLKITLDQIKDYLDLDEEALSKAILSAVPIDMESEALRFKKEMGL